MTPAGLAAVLAAVAVGCSVALLWPSLPRVPAVRRPPTAVRVVVAAALWWAGARLQVCPGLHDLAAGGATTLAPAVLAGFAAIAAARLRRQAVSRRLRAACAAAVLEICEELAGELAAGAAPGTALERAARRWPELAAPATAHRLGAAVPAAWRVLAQRPGAGDLHVVAAAWQVAERAGAGLAEALAGVAAGIREQQRTRRLVASELASARATARLMAGLPLLTLAVGSGAGDPVGFLLGTPAGLACAVAGLTLALAGVAWIEAIASALEREAAWQPGPTP